MTNKELYKDFCKQEKGLPIFHQDWWLDIVCAGWDVAIVKNGDDIAGVWPYVIESKLGVSIVRDPVLTSYLGPYVSFPDDLKPSKRDGFEYDTIAQLLEQMPDAQVWSTALMPELKQVGLFNDNGFDVGVRQTFIMPLAQDMEELFSRLHEDHRRKVRKALKELTIADEPELLEELWSYQKSTLEGKDVAMHFSVDQLKRLHAACAERGQTSLWVARKDDKVQAIVWHVWDGERAYYLVGGKAPSSKNNNAMTALLWHAIERSKAQGLISFDFEGSMDSGVERFFRNFGADRSLYLVLKKNRSTIWKLKELVR